MRIRDLLIGACLLGVASTAAAQTTAPPPAPSPAAERAQAAAAEYGFVYFEEFINPGRFIELIGDNRYPQWGEVVIAGGRLCDELPQDDVFDTLPLPIHGSEFYAEMEVTAFDTLDLAFGFAVGDFATANYDLLFLMNDFQGVWRVERWFFPMMPPLEQRTSVRAEVPLWAAGQPSRVALEARDGTYTLLVEQDGVLQPVFTDTFTPSGSQVALAIWGSVAGTRRVCFDNILVRPVG